MSDPQSPRGALLGGGWPLAAIVLAAAGLRFATLGLQSFFDDELFTAWLVRMPLRDMVSTVPTTETTPYLFYLLEWGVGRVLGTGEVALRLLPAIAGTVIVPVVYATGAIAGSRRVGLAAAAFAAVNPLLIWFSQEARAYSLCLLFVAVSLLYLVWVERGGGAAALIGWAAVAVAALATHYFAAVVIGPELVWVLASRSLPAGRRMAAAAAPVIAGVALVPLAVHQRGRVTDPGGLAGKSVGERLAQIPKNFLVGFAIPAEVLVTVLAGVLAAAAVLLALRSAHAAERRLALRAGALVAVGIGIPLLLVPLGLDYLSSRNEIVVLLPLVLLVGCGLAAGRAGLVVLCGLAMISLVAVFAVFLGPQYQRRDWRGGARALGPPRADRALLVTPPLSLGPLQVYFGPRTTVYPAGRQLAREIAVVALPEESAGRGAPAPPSGPAPAAPRGFRRTEDARTDTYRLIRFTASRRTPVDPRGVRALAFPGRATRYLWQLGGTP